MQPATKAAGGGSGGKRIINPNAPNHAETQQKGDPSMGMTLWKDPTTITEYVGVALQAADTYVEEHPLQRHLFMFLAVLGILSIVVAVPMYVRRLWRKQQRR